MFDVGTKYSILPGVVSITKNMVGLQALIPLLWEIIIKNNSKYQLTFIENLLSVRKKRCREGTILFNVTVYLLGTLEAPDKECEIMLNELGADSEIKKYGEVLKLRFNRVALATHPCH